MHQSVITLRTFLNYSLNSKKLASHNTLMLVVEFCKCLLLMTFWHHNAYFERETSCCELTGMDLMQNCARVLCPIHGHLNQHVQLCLAKPHTGGLRETTINLPGQLLNLPEQWLSWYFRFHTYTHCTCTHIPGMCTHMDVHRYTCMCTHT